MGVTSSRTTAAENSRLRRLVERFPAKSVLVVGDLMLDRYIRGHADRISPEAPVPVVRVSEESCIPGGAGNVAVNIAALGGSVSVLGVIGPDEAGAQLRALLSSRGVAVSGLIQDAKRLTSQKCRVIAERQQVVRYDSETREPLSPQTEAALLNLLPRAVETCSAVVLSDYGKGVLRPRLLGAAVRWARRLSRPVAVDPKPEHFRLYRGVTCVTPNLREAFAGMRREENASLEAVVALGSDIVRLLGCRSALITRGPDGMSLFGRNGKPRHIPTRAREVFDVSGAGDTVIAALALALAAGARIEDAAALANHAAGIVVGKLGTATCSPAELLRELR
ncbi:MAG: D-glycero-beta-D-manno-heptose-7-phosphate kinase [Elusimicrobia bacterium]|nr:D-glycero-beta-D-manno-heptose-7-phosphate kinase [Elusimicrobiota bacterium]MDE2237639.1 D-glycero-beta-D-manno-heptose-7-phosphate kinase [Elusimicrobiota bacterium]MDE2424886.1 D-glycero-beta-D-manno-heptose-7-phosphate kinase [Elusimicrobiota bacterium]